MKLPIQRLVAVAVSVAVVLLIVWSFLPKPQAVDLGEVVRGPMRVTVDEDGVTRVRERYVVSSPLAGRLRRVALKAGAQVRAGQTLLAVIEPANPQLLDVRARAEAKARVKATEATVEQTAAQVARAESGYKLAGAELKRARDLHETGVLSRQELDRAETTEKTSADELKAARFASQVACFEVEQARAALLQFSAEEGTAGKPFEVRAPIDGRVLRVLQESETILAPGTPLLELGDPADLEVVIDLLSADGVKVEPGAKMILERWGGSDPLTARVRLVEPSAFLKISALGVEEQRVNVIGDLVDPPEQRPTLGDAFRVEARIVIWESEDAVKVPTSAVFRQGEEWAVFVVEAGRARLRRVTLGHQNGLEAEVIDGLRQGERVILHPGDRVDDGVRIEERTAVTE